MWEFHRRQRKMSLTTSIFNNVLQTSGFTVEERLVREALQNSVDAHRETAELPVSVRIEKRVLEGSVKAAFVSALQLATGPAERRDLFELPEENALDTAEDDNVPLPVVIVSDYNAKGLGGTWDGTGGSDHFGRLVVNLGIDDKADAAEISGGSFGFGKTVYGKASRIGVVAFYSVFPPSEATGGAHARFMATGLFKAHEYRGEKYDGFAFLGSPSDPHSGEVVPEIDAAAHALAEQCGLAVRSPHDYGTTIVIVDCDYKIDDLVRAAELYWWPRLLRNELDVIFLEGEKEVVPRPKQNHDVQPFIAAYQNLVSETDDPPRAMIIRPERRIGSSEGPLHPGVLSATLLEGETKFTNSVALIRGPGMVVNYHPCGMESHEPCVGVFSAHSDVEKMLTYSEPPMHDRWDHTSDRLRQRFPEDGERVVRLVMQRVEKQFRDFQRRQEPPLPPGGLKPRDLTKLLGRFLDVPGKTPDPPPPAPLRPISISVSERRVAVSGDVWDEAVITLDMRPDHNEETLECWVTVAHEVLGDSSLRLVGRSECILQSSSGDILNTGMPATVKVRLDRGVSHKLVAKALSDDVSVTRMRVAVEQAHG